MESGSDVLESVMGKISSRDFLAFFISLDCAHWGKGTGKYILLEKY